MTDEVNNNTDMATEVATLKQQLLEANNSKAAIEMKARKSEEALYDENYLAFLEAQKQGKLISPGNTIDDYSEEEIAQMSAKQIAKIAAADAYAKMRNEDNKEKARNQSMAQKANINKARKEIAEFAKTKPDFGELVPIIQDLSDDNPKLSLEQLYLLAGGKHFKKAESLKAEDVKDKLSLAGLPNTQPKGEGGVVKSDSALSLRDVIKQEFQKHQKI